MSEIFNFENLAAYQRSLDLVEHIYCCRNFPKKSYMLLEIK